MNLTQTLKDKYFKSIEEQIKEILYWSVFEPLIDVIKRYNEQINQKDKQILNANEDALKSAIRSGRVQYKDGIFSGSFNSSIGKAIRSIGGNFNARSGVYKIVDSKVPSWVKSESVVYQMVAKEAHEEMRKVLNYTHDALDQMVNRSELDLGEMVDMIDGDFNSIVAKVKINPKLSESSLKKLKEEYTTNTKLSIRSFSEDMIQELRKSVEDNANTGYRFDRLIDIIQSRYDVTKNKAKFLARNETAIYMSKFRKERFKESGCRAYIWSTSHDEKVRKSHKDMNGKKCFYDDPPIVDGFPVNAGEAPNCRCVDIPILEPIEV